MQRQTGKAEYPGMVSFKNQEQKTLEHQNPVKFHSLLSKYGFMFSNSVNTFSCFFFTIYTCFDNHQYRYWLCGVLSFDFLNVTTGVPSLKCDSCAIHKYPPQFGNITLQTAHATTPPNMKKIPTSGASQYGKLVSPFPSLGRMKGVMMRNAWAARKKNARGSQTLNGLSRSGACLRRRKSPTVTAKATRAVG